MLVPQNFYKLLAGALLSAAAITACGLDNTGSGDDYAKESPACLECQAILVECTSTSRDEAQFVQCRDQWQTCQNGRGLTPETCGNPDDADACSLCRDRMTECKKGPDADDKTCEQEFGICKAYLITRGDIQQQCTATEEVPPEVACGVCQKDLATCVSDSTMTNAAQICADKFTQCATANNLTPEQCESPTGAQACTMCTDQHSECAAADGPACADGFNSCATTIASDVTCALDTAGPGSGGAGGGDGGAGGDDMGGGGAGGDTGDMCAHDVCAEGEGLTIGCDGGTCVEAVCANDSWCCDNLWDEFCVQDAQTNAACTCGT